MKKKFNKKIIIKRCEIFISAFTFYLAFFSKIEGIQGVVFDLIATIIVSVSLTHLIKTSIGTKYPEIIQK